MFCAALIQIIEGLACGGLFSARTNQLPDHPVIEPPVIEPPELEPTTEYCGGSVGIEIKEVKKEVREITIMNFLKLSRTVVAACILTVSFSANAYNILFAHVADTTYVADGNGIASMLSSAGHTVTTRYLNQAVYSDYSTFDQIFVYDLTARSDNSANQMNNYAGIANWYNNLGDQNLILDGRIISSYSSWTNANGMSPEDAWIQNYATQLGLRGGGLVLGTDHDVFQHGINYINDLIGVNRFSGVIYGSQAVVDPLSPLYVSGLDVCRADPTQHCINDNSSTGYVATGLQANGQTLTPVAYHGTTLGAWSNAAVSSTMGSATFGTCGNPGQPPCVVTVPEPASLALMGLGLFGLGFSRRRKSN